MRHYEFAFLFVTGSFLMGMASCAADSMKPPSETQPTSSVAQAQEEKPSYRLERFKGGQCLGSRQEWWCRVSPQEA